MTPDWVILTIWFVASLAAATAFYFLGSRNGIGLVLSILGTILATATAVLLGIRNDRHQRSSTLDTPLRLLSYVWSYPLSGTTEASWAVKESSILRGELGSAREHPGLGVSIVTTELVLLAFKEAGLARMDLCISWAIGRTQPRPPYEILDDIRDYRHDDIKKEFDLRHTLAFAVVLARANKHNTYLKNYLQLALETQLEDGSWPSGTEITTSPVFTTFMAQSCFIWLRTMQTFTAIRRESSQTREIGLFDGL